MRTLINSIISIGRRVLPFRLLKAGKHLPVLLPFYHLVSDDELPYRNNYNYPGIAQFEKDLDFLLSHFKPIELGDMLTGKNVSGCFHLSFDDGLASCYHVIAPILKRKGIPATFFINPVFVDNKDLFHRYKASVIINQLKDRSIHINLQETYADIGSLDELAADLGISWDDFLENEKPYMTMDQICELQKDGFTIGAHSMDHPEFWLLDEESQLEEIRESMDWIRKNLDQPIKAFSFPFTDMGVPDSVFETCKKENLFDVSFGTAGLKKELIPVHFQRVVMENDRGLSAKKLLKEEYLSFRLKQLLNKHIARRDN